MKAISLWQPWASLLVTRQPARGPFYCAACEEVEGVPCPQHAVSRPYAPMIKRFETRSWPAPKSIVGTRVAFHAAKRYVPFADAEDAWLAINRDIPMNRIVSTQIPLGVVVGSGVISRSLPIVAPVPIGQLERTERIVQVGPIPGRLAVIDTWHRGGEVVEDISDQLPYGDFTPGRFAWVIEDVEPTEARCPWCNGHGGFITPRQTSDERAWIGSHDECHICDGAGKCAPIAAVGRQGFWNWQARVA